MYLVGSGSMNLISQLKSRVRVAFEELLSPELKKL
jgi:hypothetical protein